MCTPIIGGIIAGIGSLMSASHQSAQAKAQAQFHERQAAMERQRGAFDARRVTSKARRLAGQQVANYAASGVQLAGSPGSIIDDTAAEAALDVGAIRYGAGARATNELYQAKLNRASARGIAAAAPFNFLAPVIGGAGRQISIGKGSG